MNILRFVLPFLFVRNWYDGTWEFSRMRITLFLIGVAFVIAGILIAHILQSPEIYYAT